MERAEAVLKLMELRDKKINLFEEAARYGITIDSKKNPLRKNKGWVGQTIERLLGLPLNSSREPNGGSWELKSVKYYKTKKGIIKPKETIAITQIDEDHLINDIESSIFEKSHLFTKLRRMITAAVLYEGDTKVILIGIGWFDLEADPELYAVIKEDYNLVVESLRKGTPLTGRMGTYIQPRTKGAGGLSKKTRAFYCRKKLVSKFFDEFCY